jgi:hypothetical protein
VAPSGVGGWAWLQLETTLLVFFFFHLPIFFLLMISHHRTLIIQLERPESLSVGSTEAEVWLAAVCWAVRLLLEVPLQIRAKLATRVCFPKFNITLKLTKCMTTLADAGPLGGNQNVTFNEIWWFR